MWTFLEAWQNDRCPPVRLIRCLSTDTRSYDPRYKVSDPKSWFPSSSYRFFCLTFLHVICIALVYTLPVAFVFFRFFFPRVFAKISTGFFVNTPTNSPLLNQKKNACGVIVSFYQYTKYNFQIENRKTELGKNAGKHRLVLTAGPAPPQAPLWTKM